MATIPINLCTLFWVLGSHFIAKGLPQIERHARRPLRCVQCTGADCMGSFCTGTYCIAARFQPSHFAEPPVTVKGCASGNMLVDGVPDFCEVPRKSEREKEYETSDDVHSVKYNQRHKCHCSGGNGRHCGNSPYCHGDYCTFVKNTGTNETWRGCSDGSVPLLERHVLGACTMPPITLAMTHADGLRGADLTNTYACLCKGDGCNALEPTAADLQPEHKRCNLTYRYKASSHPVRFELAGAGYCRSEYCYKLDLTVASQVHGFTPTYNNHPQSQQAPLWAPIDPPNQQRRSQPTSHGMSLYSDSVSTPSTRWPVRENGTKSHSLPDYLLKPDATQLKYDYAQANAKINLNNNNPNQMRRWTDVNRQSNARTQNHLPEGHFELNDGEPVAYDDSIDFRRPMRPMSEIDISDRAAALGLIVLAAGVALSATITYKYCAHRRTDYGVYDAVAVAERRA